MAEPPKPASAAQGARCALHAGQPFTAVCKRCGTYMCQSCTEGGKFPFCPSCRARTGVGTFPFERERFQWGALLRFAWTAYKKNWLALTGTLVIAAAAMALVQGLTFVLQMWLVDEIAVLLALQALLVVPQALLQALLTLALLSVALRAASGMPIDGSALRAAAARIWSFLLQSLVLGAIAIPIVLVLVAPVVGVVFLSTDFADLGLGFSLMWLSFGVLAAAYVMLGLAFSSIELVAQPQIGAIDAIRNSWVIARGQRLAVLLVAIVSGALMLMGFAACFIGALFSAGFAAVLFSSLYLTLRNGTNDLVS